MGIFPIGLKLQNRRVVVVGGGPVGRRKAVSLESAGAMVRVIALEPRPPGLSLNVEWITESYRFEHLTDAVLVIAAANPEVNAAVVADARERGIWVCDAAEPDRGDFTIPAVHRVGELTLAIDTAVRFPALAAQLRDRFAAELDDSIAIWVELLREMRILVLRTVPDSQTRRTILRELAGPDWHDRIRNEGIEATRAAMRSRILGGDNGTTPLY